MQDKNIVVLNYDSDAELHKSGAKKPIIIAAVIIFVMLIIGATVIMLKPDTQRAADSAELSENGVMELTDMQKLYMQLCGKEIVVDFISEDYFGGDNKYQITENDERVGTISTEDSHETITFTIFNEEDDSPDTAIDFVYHEYINDVDTYVMKTGENTYQHFNGGVTTEFDSLEDAMREHELLR